MSEPSGPHASLLVALRTLICASEYPFVTFFLLKGKEDPGQYSHGGEDGMNIHRTDGLLHGLCS